MKRTSLILVILSLYLSSCHSPNTTVATLKDPNFIEPPFNNVLIIVVDDNLKRLKDLEELIASELLRNGTNAIANHKVLPDIREYSDEERDAVFEENEIDSYMVIVSDGVRDITSWVPTRTETTVRTKKSKDGKTVKGKATTVTTEGGNRITGYMLSFSAKFYDSSDGKVIWKGDAKTYWSKSDYIEVMESVSLNYVQALIDDKIVKPKKRGTY